MTNSTQEAARRPVQAVGTRQWLVPEVPGVRAEWAAFTTESFAPHMHDTLSLCAYDTGCQDLEFRGKSILGAAGTLVAINPGDTHAGRAADEAVGWSCRVLHFSPALLAEAAAEVGAAPGALPGLTQRLLPDAEGMARFGRTFQALTREGAERLDRESATLGLLVWLLGRHAGLPGPRRLRGACPRGVRRARELLDASVDAGVSLQALADAAGLSRWHLVRAFDAHVGQTPLEYLRSRRLHRTRELLATDMPLAEVAAACGFTDQSHLHRHVLRLTGLTPGRYRAAVRAAR